MTKTYEQLAEEVAYLRRKLSPLEDKKFTEQVLANLPKVDMEFHVRDFRGRKHIVVTPAQIFEDLFGFEPNTHQSTLMGRSLQALCWERSALHGQLVFVIELEEYRTGMWRKVHE